jgi:hypothetical protein
VIGNTIFDIFPGFQQNSFEKKHAVTCSFLIEFCENPGNIPTKWKTGIKIQKRIMHSLNVFKRVSLIQNVLMLSGYEIINSV